MSRSLLLSLQLLVAGCGGQSAPVVDEPIVPIEAEAGLAGVWTTHGVDETFGEVEVEMTLGVDGRLSMVLVLASGGRRSFPGGWTLDGDELVLSGAYFEPDGESRVRWRIEDSLLVLEDATGQQQQWQRKE